MRKLIAVAAAALFCSAVSQAAPDQPFDPSRDPARDLIAAEQAAQREHKHILLDAGGNWCGWCKLLDRTTHTDAAVSSLLQSSFIVVHVNWSPENHNDAFFGRYPRVNGYPFFFVLDEKGKLLKSQSTDIFETDHQLTGGYNSRKLQQFLRQWSPAGTA